MNRMTMPIRVALLLAVAGISITGAMAADSPTAVKTRPAPPPAVIVANPAATLDAVQWAGPGVGATSLQGKTTIIMPFVTWCPICNAWAPDFLDQLTKATDNKSVVIVAVCTDVNAAPGKDFLIKKGLAGPNVVYGANPKMNELLGMDPKNLWNFVWIDPTGKVKTSGMAGSYYLKAGDKHDYVLPHQLSAANDLGKLQFVTEKMSPTVKGLAWSMEMGNLAMLVKISQPKNLHGLSKEDQESLQTLSTQFLDEQLAAAKTLLSGDLVQKMEGFDKATQLSTTFKTTPQGKEANLLVVDLNGDAMFKKELAARSLYQQDVAKAGGDDAKLVKLLHAVAQRFPETQFGDLAKKKIDEAVATK